MTPLQFDPAWTYSLSQVEQYALSSLLVLGFLAGTTVVYWLGPWLKSELSDDGAEAVQSIVVTALGALTGAGFVVVWRLAFEVRSALVVIRPSAVDGVKLLVTLLAFGMAYTATRITKRFVRFGAGRDHITEHQEEILHHVVQIVVFLPAVVFAFALWKVPAQNVLLSASVIGVVLGLAARQTLGAVLAGFVLLFSRPFEVGDWVEIDDHEGIVTDISVVNTRIQSFDDEMVMLPNDQIANEPITNKSRNDRLRVQIEVGVDYDTDVHHAMDVAATAMQGHDELMEAPEPDVVVDSFGDSAVVLNLRFWIASPTIQRKWAAQNAVIESVKEAFETEGIEIPFPQRALSGREGVGGLAVAGEAVEAPPDVDEDESEADDGRADTAGGDGDSDAEVEPAIEPAFETDEAVASDGAERTATDDESADDTDDELAEVDETVESDDGVESAVEPASDADADSRSDGA